MLCSPVADFSFISLFPLHACSCWDAIGLGTDFYSLRINFAQKTIYTLSPVFSKQVPGNERIKLSIFNFKCQISYKVSQNLITSLSGKTQIIYYFLFENLDVKYVDGE